MEKHERLRVPVNSSSRLGVVSGSVWEAWISVDLPVSVFVHMTTTLAWTAILQAANGTKKGFSTRYQPHLLNNCSDGYFFSVKPRLRGRSQKEEEKCELSFQGRAYAPIYKKRSGFEPKAQFNPRP